MLDRSASETSLISSRPCFDTESDSPVRELSLTCKDTLSRILPSATARSPLSRYRISPGTTSADGIEIFSPPLMTTAQGAERDLRLSRDFLAFSC